MPLMPVALVQEASGELWTSVIKQADESVASNTTPQNDDELFFTVADGTIYEVEIVLIVGSPAGGGTPDIKIAFGEDGTNRGNLIVVGLSTADAGIGTALVADQTSTNALGTAATKRAIFYKGFYTGAGGTFRVLWAQNASGVNATIVYAGSHIKYRVLI